MILGIKKNQNQTNKQEIYEILTWKTLTLTMKIKKL